jgi:hypothetical protein
MGRIAQAGFNKTVETRLAEIEANQVRIVALFDKIVDRIMELEAKRGPGRPKVERDPASEHRKV